MVRAPHWSKEEFELLLKNHGLSDDDLAALLPGRTAGAVAAVRAGVHRFHEGQDPKLLSQMMRSRLEQREEDLLCALCGAKL